MQGNPNGRRRLRPVVLLAGVAGGVLGFADPASAAPAATVTPSTGVQDGQAVTVKATGFTAGVQVFIAQCAPNADKLREDCAESSVKTAMIGADGTVTVSDYVVKTGQKGTSGESCAVGGDCMVMVTTIDTTQKALTNFSFAAAQSETTTTTLATTTTTASSQVSGAGATNTTTTTAAGATLARTGPREELALGGIALVLMGGVLVAAARRRTAASHG